VLISLSLLSGCGAQRAAPAVTPDTASTASAATADAKAKDIVILYTNDVHCAVDKNIGYASLAAYKKDMESKTDYVTLVDCGDAIQGDYIAALSSGSVPIEIMNDVGYDYAVLGNHEFDYGMPQLSALLKKANAQYLGCNITYTGTGESAVSSLKPYDIVDYGGTKVALIGVSTPLSITSSSPINFQENGVFVYDFCGASGEELYACVQKNVDECRAAGADYVVLLTHLGDTDTFSPFSSVELADNTTGVDAILDGHAHDVIPCRVEQNKDGADVLLTSTGTNLASIGQLTITAGGTLTAGLISQYTPRDAQVDAQIKAIQADFDAQASQVVATSNSALSTMDDSGVRLVRNRETTIGDFCADAYRAAGNADIGLINGGGVRADLPTGEITYKDVLSVNPFGNALCVAKATGQQVLDALEMGCRKTESQTSANGLALGENGGFLQVSGLKFTIDTSIASAVTLDENGMFASVDGPRRVQDVQVEGADGSYSPLDPAATYTVASSNYVIKKGGDGNNVFAGDEFLIDEGTTDYQMLIDYLAKDLNGQLGEKYSALQGRITVK
jgi:2',3'-cyclic-nucleotide 2'-phosphodiesterase (5'-nucleotidase family)